MSHLEELEEVNVMEPTITLVLCLPAALVLIAAGVGSPSCGPLRLGPPTTPRSAGGAQDAEKKYKYLKQGRVWVHLLLSGLRREEEQAFQRLPQ
jgi:hypothetical protein